MKHPPEFFCELCQKYQRTPVYTNDNEALPMCRACWNELPLPTRARIMSEARHHRDIGEPLREIAGFLQDVREEAKEQGRQWPTDPFSSRN